MAEDIQLIAAIGLVYIWYKRNTQQIVKKRKIRYVWVKEWLANREIKCAFGNIVSELYLRDDNEFRK